LFGSNTYTGPTIVQAGSLVVNGSLAAASLVAVTGTGQLAGSGTVGVVSVSGSGAIYLGGGALTTRGAAFASPTSSVVTPLYSTSDYGRLNATGAVDLTQHPALSVQPGFTANVGDTFTIVTSTTGVTGTFANLPDGAAFLANGQRFQIFYNPTSVVLERIGNP